MTLWISGTVLLDFVGPFLLFFLFLNYNMDPGS